MVKKIKAISQLEKDISNRTQDLDEEFVRANDYVTNENLNDDEHENFNDLDEKDEILIEKLRNIDGRRRWLFYFNF